MTTLIELARSSVQTWECDAMGHMNVQFYVARAADALAALGTTIGVGPNYARAHDTGFYPVDQHLRFHKEMRAGTPFVVYGGVLEARGHSLRAYLEMRHALTDVVTATFICENVFAERAALKSRTLPTSALEKAESLKTLLPSHGAPRGVMLAAPRPAPVLAEAERLKLLRTYQGLVRPEDCDRFGFMVAQAYMGRVSDAIPNLIAQLHGRDRGASDVGGAALEYRFVFREAAQEGDVLLLRSGLKAVGGKTHTFVHWMFDMESGEAVATAEAVAVSMDLATRKAVEITPEARAQLERHITPGLSI